MLNLIGRRIDANGTPHVDVEAFLVMRADKTAIEDALTALHAGNIAEAMAAIEHIGDDRLFAFLQAHPIEVQIAEASAASATLSAS